MFVRSGVCEYVFIRNDSDTLQQVYLSTTRSHTVQCTVFSVTVHIVLYTMFTQTCVHWRTRGGEDHREAPAREREPEAPRAGGDLHEARAAPEHRATL